jgi:hypothetical protein
VRQFHRTIIRRDGQWEQCDLSYISRVPTASSHDEYQRDMGGENDR